MRSHAVALVLLVPILALGSCSSDGKDPSASGGNGGPTVSTKLLSYDPQELTVKAGTTVTWTVGDNIGHTVTTGSFELGGDGLRTSENADGMLDQPIGPGKDATFTFEKPGTYTYYCSIHKGMTGVVEVTK